MLLDIKLYGGLRCLNRNSEYYGLDRFQMEVSREMTLGEIHRQLNLSTSHSLVSIVDGHAEAPEYMVESSARISVFPPMADRQYDFFQKLY